MFCSWRRFLGGDLKVGEGPGPHLVEMSTQPGDTLGVELIEPARPGTPVNNKTRVLEYFQVLRDSRAADWKGTREHIYGEWPARELLEDGHARGVAECVESSLEECIHISK
jgi:hypothetical protein